MLDFLTQPSGRCRFTAETADHHFFRHFNAGKAVDGELQAAPEEPAQPYRIGTLHFNGHSFLREIDDQSAFCIRFSRFTERAFDTTASGLSIKPSRLTREHVRYASLQFIESLKA